ncbi:hypothetical protein QJS10_CPA10g00314 [Acorus calamus]|uniref:Uncharacterized protein n=1 Tax=Acorus calamus TaxID=4465 RepID=A0AAV9DZX3_ACOCL|nr:hypothetical protein QJS10_CPA10g00314 [Acorus calamus]
MGDEEVYKLGKLLDDVADGRKEAQSDFKEKNQNQIESCLQHLELGLTSVLRPLKSRADADVAPEDSVKQDLKSEATEHAPNRWSTDSSSGHSNGQSASAKATRRACLALVTN